MPKYISVNDFCDEVDKGELLTGDNAAWAKEIANKLPSANVAPVVYGRWINPYMNRYGHPCHCCSVCGFKASYQDKNYCPNCGAKMNLET